MKKIKVIDTGLLIFECPFCGCQIIWKKNVRSMWHEHDDLLWQMFFIPYYRQEHSDG